MMMAESFNDRVVADCIAKYFQLDHQALQFRSNAKMTLLCSPVCFIPDSAENIRAAASIA